MNAKVNVIDKITSLSGVVHVIDRTGIFTNGVRRPFEWPIINDIDKAVTSPSGVFISLIVHGKLYLVTICQSQLDLEMLGYQEILFCDSTFNNEESLFIALDNDSVFHFYELYPPLEICTKVARIPEFPMSFKYYQLQNAFKITTKTDVNFLFKFPDLFDPNDPPELPFIKNMIQDENEHFIQLFEEEEEAANENDMKEETAEGHFIAPSNLTEFASQTLQRGKFLQNRQNDLKERYKNVLERIDNYNFKSFEICGRLRDAKKKMTEQIKKIYDILGSIDGYADLISKEYERFKDLEGCVETNLCDDDVITEEQETKFKSFQFYDRLKNIERKIYEH